MDMKLFSLTRAGETVPVKLQIKVIGSLSSFTDSDLTFEEHKSLKEMFSSFAKALKEKDLIVIAVAGNIYNSTKIKLMNALSLQTQCNEIVAQRLEELGLESDIIEKNALMPAGATVFQSSDGIYSGFAIKKGKQTIALIPLDEHRIDSVLKRGLVPYLTNGGKLNKIYEAPKNETANAKSEPVKEELEPINNEIAVRTINILKENDLKIAVNGNVNSIILKEFGQDIEDFEDYFIFTPHVEDKGDYSVTDYTAQLAKSAKEVSNATLGACVSDIYTSDECDYICIAVATEKSALVRKLYKDNDDTDEGFMRIAAEELFALICEKAEGNNAVGIEIADEEDEAESSGKKLDPKTAKIIIAVVSIILVLAIVTGVLFFVKQKKEKEDITTTTAPTTTKVTTTQPVIEVKTELLSDIMLEKFLEQSSGEQAAATEGEQAEQNNNTAKSETAPSVIKVNGEQLDAKQAVARIVEAEMDKSYNNEALKAQAVITYSYLKQSNWKISEVKLVDKCSDEVLKAVNEVFGEYITVDGKYAYTPYFLMSAGKSASSETVFGIKTSQLVSLDCSSDKLEEGYKTEVSVKAQDVRAAISAYDSSIALDEDDTKLIEIKANDGCVDKKTGYVSKIAVGDKEISGYEFIYKVLKNDEINSTCFAIEYDEATGMFKFTVYGSGIGVGMSQKAANYDAGRGKKYDSILKAYFKDIKLEKDTVEETTTGEAASETTTARANNNNNNNSSNNSSNKNKTTTTTKKPAGTTAARVSTTAATTAKPVVATTQAASNEPQSSANTQNGSNESDNVTPEPGE